MSGKLIGVYISAAPNFCPLVGFWWVISYLMDIKRKPYCFQEVWVVGDDDS